LRKQQVVISKHTRRAALPPEPPRGLSLYHRVFLDNSGEFFFLPSIKTCALCGTLDGHLRTTPSAPSRK
jgi:hypothetical protein